VLLQPPRTKRLKRRQSRLRPLLFRIAGVIAVLVLIEVGTRGCVDSVTSRSIHSRTVGVGDVDVASGDAPTALRYWVLGGLQNGSVTMHDIVAVPVSISALEVKAEDLRFSRTKLLTGKADLTGSAPYRTTLYLSPKNLGSYLNATVRFQSNHLVATIEGHSMNVVPKLKGRSIVIEDERFTYEVPLPSRAYLPCKPDAMGVGNGIAVSCQSDVLPPFVAAAATR